LIPMKLQIGSEVAELNRAFSGLFGLSQVVIDHLLKLSLSTGEEPNDAFQSEV